MRSCQENPTKPLLSKSCRPDSVRQTPEDNELDIVLPSLSYWGKQSDEELNLKCKNVEYQHDWEGWVWRSGYITHKLRNKK